MDERRGVFPLRAVVQQKSAPVGCLDSGPNSIFYFDRRQAKKGILDIQSIVMASQLIDSFLAELPLVGPRFY